MWNKADSVNNPCRLNNEIRCELHMSCRRAQRILFGNHRNCIGCCACVRVRAY